MVSDQQTLNYQRLDSERIEETIDRLSQRIQDRFPQSNLVGVCQHLLSVARQARERATWIAKPVVSLRIASWSLVALIVGGCATTLFAYRPNRMDVDFFTLVQLVESGINDVVFVGIAVFFLVTLETRIKRRRAMAAIAELRATVHIIDMHQLTKDPERIRSPRLLTASSPRESMTLFELGRYLGYCTEMLSLSGKIAALYVQDFDDTAVIAAGNEVEELTTGLSRKIWQKITLLHSYEESAASSG